MLVAQGHNLEKKNQSKKQADVVLSLSSKMNLGNNCSMLNINDFVPSVRRVNRYN